MNFNHEKKSLKTKLESKNLSQIDAQLFKNIDLSNVNCCCSNSSYYFIYVESKSLIFAININKLTKFDVELNECYQILTITAPPVGIFKRLSLNKSGTHILLVYSETIGAVELPIKWGKHDDYEGGRKRIMCRTIQMNIKNSISIVDALWHGASSNEADNDVIIALVKYSNNSMLKFFSIENPEIVLKSTVLNNLNESLIIDNEKKFESFLSIQMGTRFDYGGKSAHPIFILRANGQITCVVELEGNNRFINLGSLTMDPYCMDFDRYQAIDFLCLQSEPNCLVLLLDTGVLHHCLFIPHLNADQVTTLESTVFIDDQNTIVDSEALLFVYETTKIDTGDDDSLQVKLLKDPSDPCHYFIYNKMGVHCVYLPWLESAKVSLNKNDLLDPNDFDEDKLSEFRHLICTQPIESNYDSSTIVGLSLVHEIGSRELAIAFTNKLDLISAFINKTSRVDFERLDAYQNSTYSNEINKDKFLNHIRTLLKKSVSLPTIKSDIGNDSNKNCDVFVLDVINSLKSEYLEKQKLAFNEILKRSKLLKQQEQTEKEKLREINGTLDKLRANKIKLEQKYTIFHKRQNDIANRLDRISTTLNDKMPKFTDNEIRMQKDLMSIQKDVVRLEQQINDKKELINLNELTNDMNKSMTLNKSDFSSEELANIKVLLKNEGDKIKDLIQKVTKLKIAVKI